MATKHTSRQAARRSARGFSLLEAAIVVAIVAIVGAVALPSFTALVEARRLDGAATRLAADVQFARSEAIARNRSLRLSIAAGTEATCWVIHTGAANDCRCHADGVVCTNGALAIRSAVPPSAEHVAVAGNVGSLVFDPLHGTSTPTGTLSLSDARGRSVRHVVNVVGRVRSCSPDRAIVGYPGCWFFRKEIPWLHRPVAPAASP